MSDGIQLIRDDHSRVRGLFEEYARAGNLDTKQQLALQLMGEISLHDSLELNLMYPLMSQVLEDDDILSRSLDEHALVRAQLQNIPAVSDDESGLDQLISKIRADLEAHMEEEELDMLPRLGTQLSDASNAEFARAILAFKQTSLEPSIQGKPGLVLDTAQKLFSHLSSTLSSSSGSGRAL